MTVFLMVVASLAVLIATLCAWIMVRVIQEAQEIQDCFWLHDGRIQALEAAHVARAQLNDQKFTADRKALDILMDHVTSLNARVNEAAGRPPFSLVKKESDS